MTQIQVRGDGGPAQVVEVRFWKADLTRFDEDWERDDSQTTPLSLCFGFGNQVVPFAEEGVAG